MWHRARSISSLDKPLGRYEEQIKRSLQEIASLREATAVLDGQQSRSRNEIYASSDQFRYKVSSPDSDQTSVTFIRHDMSFLQRMAGIQTWSASCTINMREGTLQNGTLTLKKQGTLLEKKEKSLSVRTLALILKKIVDEQQKALTQKNILGKPWNLEEFFVLSVVHEAEKNNVSLRSERLQKLAKEIYVQNQSIFKHSEPLGQLLLKPLEEFITEFQRLLETSTPKLRTYHENAKKEWIKKEVRGATDTLHQSILAICSKLGSGDDRFDTLHSVTDGTDTFYAAQVVTQDRMMKFETVGVLGRWDGRCLEIFVVDDGLVKYWKNDQMKGLNPEDVMERSYRKHAFGFDTRIIQDADGSRIGIAEGEPHLFARPLLSVDFTVEDYFDTFDTLQQLLRAFEKVWNYNEPDASKQKTTYTEKRLGHPPSPRWATAEGA